MKFVFLEALEVGLEIAFLGFFSIDKELVLVVSDSIARKSDKVASQLLAAYGMDSLAYTAKLHFANTKKAQALLK